MKITGLVALVFILCSLTQEKSTLNIEISGIRNKRGVLRISVYTAENQYPYNPAKAYVIKKDSLSSGKIRTSICDLVSGRYGLCVLDDENNSGQMESNMIGLPVEGYGFANNVKPFLKHPDFDRVQFTLFPGINHMNLIIRYRN